MVIEFIKHLTQLSNGNIIVVGGTGRYLRGYRNKELNPSFIDVSFKTTEHFDFFKNEIEFSEIENTFPYPCTQRYVGRTIYNGQRFTLDVFINPQDLETMVVNVDEVMVTTLTDQQDLWYTKNLLEKLPEPHPRHFEKLELLSKIFNLQT
jgi:hypothetical protein